MTQIGSDVIDLSKMFGLSSKETLSLRGELTCFLKIVFIKNFPITL